MSMEDPVKSQFGRGNVGDLVAISYFVGVDTVFFDHGQ
jgi:hypothetical protein